ncbi:MAG: ABC transporter permease [Treponema sp.]|jgi:D-methionine transport system permease protein|nr:ABC transporter permease [Treponema sp.]
MSDEVMNVLRFLPKPTYETIYMTFASTFFACLMGLPLGAFLYSASPVGLRPRRAAYALVSRIVNALRSFPFLILMIALIPLTRFIVGTSIGPTAVIVPLSIAAAPFVARLVEAALSEVDAGIVTAAIAMGSTNFQIIRKVLIPEAMPALVSGLALTIINLIGYSAMAGAIGGGGLGALAINYGYYRFRTGIMIAAVIVILFLVEAVQLAGTLASRKLLSKM